MADDVGATFGPEPYAALSVTADGIRLEGTRGNYHIPRKMIVRIGRGGLYPWFFRSVRIRHRDAGLPANLQFKPLFDSPNDIFAQLKAFGFPTC